MNDYPTFWGVNDETGRTLEITFTGYYNGNNNQEILSVRIDTPDNPVLQRMSNEEFETYILDLYSSYSGNNNSADIIDVTVTETTMKSVITTVTKAVSTETITTASEPVKTIVTTEKVKPKESSDYLAYLAFIKAFSSEIEREFDDMMILYHCYYLYDINNDGTYELLVHIGESEADAAILIYSVDEDGTPVELGEIGGGHTRLIEKDGNLCSDLCHMGYQFVEKVTMTKDSGSWVIKKSTVSEDDNLSDYKNYGIQIKGYDISDTSAIEELCPKELLEDKPHVNAYVKTYDYSGREGFESRLYIEGDFAYVTVEARYNDDDFEFNEYDYDETLDGIVVYQGSSSYVPVLYVTPYSKASVSGDVITCNIPVNASETIKTGGFSYALNKEMKGQINCNGETVAGFTTDYVVNGGAVGKVRSSLGDKWHITAKNICYNYDVTWYELWDFDDGDYYGWVDENFIDFY
ncbi:MAG: hypothetical protein K2I00_00160 [Ruminococcus sp.]|nr:hypothetical protein [Ruminococcus sp.]